ncbi:DUF2075 domain-containing protein [Sphingobacterium chuzhouense]|uniref:DUF2075 domain-containing protein n=2 Tax=Sphingobacterium chuzhouense TaxID=1742264 RepID=A0ABR7XU97_9SPHI|nr:DUF2075 domain-containing protein [Sphingobacterium chuzhouense]
MTGFCWPWTKEADADGELHKDVVVGDYIRPWNSNEKNQGTRRGIPKSRYWAYDDAGIDQVGRIYTAQGFEFDYGGVIFVPISSTIPIPGNGRVFPRTPTIAKSKDLTFYSWLRIHIVSSLVVV